MKKDKRIPMKVIGCLSALILFMVPSISLGLTDTSSGIGSGIYTLTIVPITGGYEATFVADTNSVSGWVIDGFQIKLDTSAAGLINSVTGPFTNYVNPPSSVSLIHHNGQFPGHSFSGIYDATGTGVALNGGDYTWVFDFTLTTMLNPQALQVLFYNPTTGQTARLSQSVPEPGILILLGIAMTAVGVASYYVRKT
jgi:hypothetical protein